MTLLPLLVIFLSSLTPQSRACYPIDAEALLHFKKQITDDPHNLLKTWIPTTDCCADWDGIKCEPYSGRVNSISVSGQLSGQLSPFLGNLTYLDNLDLHGNHLSGPIPKNLGDLQQLQTLVDLSDNLLSGKIPRSIGRLSLLNSLNLSHNHLSGPIPASIGDLKMIGPLFYLDLSHNLLSGKLPRSLGKLGQLSVVFLNNNRFEGPIISEFKNVLKLVHLDLSNNSFSGPIPKDAINLEFLETFVVRNNQLSGEIPPHKIHFPASDFSGNPGLCGSPLPPCEN